MNNEKLLFMFRILYLYILKFIYFLVKKFRLITLKLLNQLKKIHKKRISINMIKNIIKRNDYILLLYLNVNWKSIKKKWIDWNNKNKNNY